MLFAIPERLDVFVETVNNYIELQQKPNSEKKVAFIIIKERDRMRFDGRRNGSDTFVL